MKILNEIVIPSYKNNFSNEKLFFFNIYEKKFGIFLTRAFPRKNAGDF